MKILVALAFAAILISLASALVYMMKASPKTTEPTTAPKGNMVRALAFRVGFSIVLFLCILVAWKMGWVQPTGIPMGT